jgi:hypothetical protein
MGITEIQKTLPKKEPKLFCVAPFVNTRQTEEGKTCPCPFGAGEWNYSKLSKKERWDAEELNDVRESFVKGEWPEACAKCKDEEKGGKDSLRNLMPNYFPDINLYNDFILPGKWLDGPIALTTKTSNICNLACRSCAGWDTSLYRKEGEHYAEKYEYTNANPNFYESLNGIQRFIPRRPKAHMDYEGFNEISSNIQKLEFIGGEPFLNTTHLDLLEHLVETGQSKNCTLFYATNGMQYPHKRMTDAWQHFKRIELGLSIDGIADRFEYLRWPGKWDKVRRNINRMLKLPALYPDVDWYFEGCTCFDLYTIYNLRDTFKWINYRFNNAYATTIARPDYINSANAPTYLKDAVKEHYNGDNQDMIDYMYFKEGDPMAFKQFCIWTKRQDLYRDQDFRTTFPHLYETIKDDFDYYSKDLSEENFYSNLDLRIQ